MKVYEKILRPLLFALTDPEKIHKTATSLLRAASTNNLLYEFISQYCTVNDPRLITKVGSMTWPNPVGLAAGFDKNIDAPHAYSMLGFGSVEFGSITYQQQSGNAKPRLWRLPKDKGLIVNYGLSNNGARCAAIRLEKFRKQLVEDGNAKNIDNNNNQLTTNYGTSIAPTTSIAFDDMAEDYAKSFDLLLPYADYITLNISCPNVVSNTITSQLNFIEKLLKTIHPKQKNLQYKKDIFIKIGSHHNTSELDQIVELSKTYQLAGIVATNLLKQREGTSFYSTPKQLAQPGGISGLPVQNLSDQTIRYLYQKSNGKLSIIGVGGIFSAEDAYRKIKLGASAVQIITGFIYGGPLIVRAINQGLVDLLKKDGHSFVLDAVGKDA